MKPLRQLLKQTPGVNRALAQVGASGFGAALVIMLQLWAASQAVNAVIFAGASLAGILPWLGAAALATLLRAALQDWRERVASGLAARAVRHWRDALTSRSLSSGANLSLSLIAQGLEKLEGYFARFLPSAVLMGVIPSLLLVFAFWVDWLTGLILLLTAPLIPLLMWLIGVAARDHAQAQFTAMQRLGAHFQDVLRGFADLKALNRSGAQTESLAASSEAWREATMRVLRVAFLNGFALEITSTIATAIVAVSSGLRLLSGHLPFDVALLSILIAPEFYAPLRQFGLEHHAGMEAEPVAEAVMAAEGHGSKAANLDPLPSPGRAVSSPVPLEIRGVSYRYADAAREAVQDLSLRVEPGMRTALVGASGSGKSTLVRLCLRFIEPDQGEIRLGGLLAAQTDPRLWREQIAWVSQAPHLFHGSVLDNLRLAAPNATPTQLWTALEAAQAAEFVEALPEGLNTLIGERGSRLSGGERQRLAIARAFLKNAPVLILDEATSSLDAFTQARVQEAIETLARHRTVLTVAHRLETVLQADQIAVLETGRIAEIGTHAQLLAHHGVYARLLGSKGVA